MALGENRKSVRISGFKTVWTYKSFGLGLFLEIGLDINCELSYLNFVHVLILVLYFVKKKHLLIVYCLLMLVLSLLLTRYNSRILTDYIKSSAYNFVCSMKMSAVAHGDLSPTDPRVIKFWCTINERHTKGADLPKIIKTLSDIEVDEDDADETESVKEKSDSDTSKSQFLRTDIFFS